MPGAVTRVGFTLDTPLGRLRTLRVRLRDEEEARDVSSASGWFLEEVRLPTGAPDNAAKWC